MDKPVTTTDDFYHGIFKELISWFDRWLQNPLSEREKILIAETVDYLKTNRVERFDADKFRDGQVHSQRISEAGDL